MFTDAQLLAYIGPNGAIGTEEATILSDIESRTVALVERATGMFLGASASFVYLLDSGGGVIRWLPAEVSAVTTVETRGSVSEAFSALDSADWEFLTTGHALGKSERLIRIDGGEWPDGDALLRVTATRGYATDAEPGPLRQLVLDLTAWQYRAGRNLSLEDLGSPNVGKVQGWDRVVNLYRGGLYG